MAMKKKQHFNPQSLLMFGFAAFLCPIVTAGFQEPLDWETGLDEELYNLQSEPISYNSFLAGLRSYSASSHPAILFHHFPFMNMHIISVLVYLSVEFQKTMTYYLLTLGFRCSNPVTGIVEPPSPLKLVSKWTGRRTLTDNDIALTDWCHW